MFEKMLEEKSEVSIVNGEWEIRPKYNERNQVGFQGEDDLVGRRDVVCLLMEMNIKLNNIYNKEKAKNPQLAEELLEATKVLDYAIWGVRELEAGEKK